MYFSGSGKIPSGEYEKISAKGRASLCGKVRCESFSMLGKSKGESLECKEDFNVSGKAIFSKDVKAKKVNVSGLLKCGGDITAESIKSSGAINCAGILKAKDIKINAKKTITIGSVNGGNIIIKRKRHLLGRKVIVKSSIAGRDLILKHVVCPRVVGEDVIIGKGCKIDFVQHSKEIKISPKAKIGKTEKI